MDSVVRLLPQQHSHCSQSVVAAARDGVLGWNLGKAAVISLILGPCRLHHSNTGSKKFGGEPQARKLEGWDWDSLQRSWLHRPSLPVFDMWNFPRFQSVKTHSPGGSVLSSALCRAGRNTSQFPGLYAAETSSRERADPLRESWKQKQKEVEHFLNIKAWLSGKGSHDTLALVHLL